MGQCFSFLSRGRNRGKIGPQPVEKNNHARPESENEEDSIAAVGKKVDTETKRKVEEVEKNIEDGSSRHMEKEVDDVESISSESSVSNSADVRELTVDEGAEEDTARGEDDARAAVGRTRSKAKNPVKQAEGGLGDEDLPKDPAVKPQEGSPRVIVVQPAANSSFSFGTRDQVVNRRADSDSSWPNINQVASLITQKTTCVYKYQGPDGKPEVVKREWDVEGLRRLANTAAQPSECGLENEADNIVKNKGFKQSVASQEGESEGEAQLCEDKTDEMKVEQDHLLIVGVGFGQPKSKVDHRKIKEKIRGSGSHPTNDVAAKDVSKDVRGNSVKFSMKDTKDSGANTDQASWLMMDKESDELNIQMTSSKSEKMDSQNGLAATEVATPARPRKVIPRRKASNLAHLIVRDRLFGSMDEPTVSEVDVQRQVTLGIADEEYWMPGHGNSSNNQGVTMGRKEIWKKTRAGGHRQQSENDARQFKDGQKSKDEGGAKPKDRHHNEATKAKQVVGNAKNNSASHEHDKFQKLASEDSSTSPEKAGKKVADASTPYWTLKDVPNTSWNRPGRLMYKQDKTDVKTEMKNIESEMAALLKPDEKCVKTCVTFTIGEGKQNGIQASGNIPTRLARKQRAEVDQVKILEKQREAERRRKDNIAKRVQSARRRSSTPKPKSPTGEKEMLYAKTMERIGAAIARRDEIISQRIHVAKKSGQLKEEVVRSREMERSKVKENVFQRAEAATARRHEIIDRRVQAAMKSGNPRQGFVEERMAGMSKEKRQIFEKMEAATSRRNEFLNRRVEIARKSGARRGHEVKERLSKTVNRQQHVLDRKMRTTENNRERMIRKTVRYQMEQEKRRELARRRLARLRRDDEEMMLQYGEMQLETYEDSDDGEDVWDDEEFP